MHCHRVAFLLVVLVLIMASAGPGFADKARTKSRHHDSISVPSQMAFDDPRFGIGNENAPLASSECADTDCVAGQQIQVNPYGCYGYSHNLHSSSHGKKKGQREITAQSQTGCGVTVRSATVSNWIYRDHTFWWGLEGKPGNKNKANTKYVESVAVTGCSSDNYLNYSFHKISGYNGKPYEGWTDAVAWVSC